VPQSDALALNWWRSAAEQGDAQAQSKLGLFYAQGSKGVGAPSDVEAVKWWQKAAEQGHANAQFNLGLMFAQVRPDINVAIPYMPMHRHASRCFFIHASSQPCVFEASGKLKGVN